jgi:hypothetical protein
MNSNINIYTEKYYIQINDCDESTASENNKNENENENTNNENENENNENKNNETIYKIEIGDYNENTDEIKIDDYNENTNEINDEIDNETVLNIYNRSNIVYPNQKIFEVAPIIEEKIIERDNYQPNCCLLNCQYYIAMLLNTATNIYTFLEYMIRIFSTILVFIDVFNITKSRIKINGRSKYNYFTIESAQSEKLRRIVYWYYYNNIMPDEEQWKSTIKSFSLVEVPLFTIRLYLNGEKSKYSIELSSITLKTDLAKGTRKINLYEDLINELIGDLLVLCGKRLLKTIDGLIPIGGLLPEKFISDLGLNSLGKTAGNLSIEKNETKKNF